MTARESISLDATVVASQEQASADLGDEAAILNLIDGVYYGLDQVGASIWKLIQEPRTVREVRDTLLDEYNVDADRCEHELIVLITELAEHDILTIIDDA